MADQVPAAQSAPSLPSEAQRIERAAAKVAGLFGDPRPAELPPAAPAEVAEVVAPTPEPTSEPNELATLIRDRREARRAREQAETESKSLKDRLAEAEGRLAKLNKMDVVADPVGFVEALGLEQAEIAALGQMLLYHLVPDKADAETRLRLMEAQRARKEKLADRRATERETEVQRARAHEVYEDYVDAVKLQAAKVAPGAYPASEDWFGGDQENYAASLIATANNMAEVARQRGEVADLSYGAVAKVLEADLDVRFQRRAKRGAAVPPAKQEPAVKPESVVQDAGTQTISTRGLTGGGAPRPPAKTEAERISRASEVVWRTR